MSLRYSKPAFRLLLCAAPLLLLACNWDDGDANNNGNQQNHNQNYNHSNQNNVNVNSEPVTLDPSDYTYTLDENVLIDNTEDGGGNCLNLPVPRGLNDSEKNVPMVVSALSVTARGVLERSTSVTLRAWW